MFINQFAEHVGAGAAIESSPLRFSKRFNSGRVVAIHEHNVDDVAILFSHLSAWFPEKSCMLTKKPMMCLVYQRNIYRANHWVVICGFSHRYTARTFAAHDCQGALAITNRSK